MASQQQPPIVAELGRPETAAETAARKAENSRLYKKRKTVNNLVYSLLVSLALMAVIVLIVPRGTGGFTERNVDVQELATAATPAAGVQLASPELPAGWLAKQAQLRYDSDTDTSYWYIGYTTPSGNYAAVMQGYQADLTPAPEAWVKQRLESKKQTAETAFAGHSWRVYDHSTDNADSSNVLWGFVTETDTAALVVSGTGTEDELMQLAEQTVASI